TAAGKPADHPVEHSAGVNLVPGVMPRLLPAADDIKAFDKLRQESRDLGWVVLEIAIECKDQFSARNLERSRECGCLSKIPAQANGKQPGIAFRQLGQHSPGSVATAIVDEDELGRSVRAACKDGFQLAV